MLLEKLTYPDDFPMAITIARMEEDPIHYHPDIELTYVLSGEIELRSGCCAYHLREGDIFTNSGNEVHSLKAVTQDNMVVSVHLSTKDLSQYFPNLRKACYRTYSENPNGQKYRHLKELLLQLLTKYMQRGFNYKSECLYIVVDLIKHLDRHFNHFAIVKDVAVGFDKDNQLASERISRICQYIYQNYAGNITLQDLSDMEYLNTYYLSHLIKEFTGMNFRDFLCFARVEMSEIQLLGSDRKVSRIAKDVGFSTTAYYNKYFTHWFGHSPAEHRRLYLSEVKCDLKPAVYQELSRSRAMEAVKNAYDRSAIPQIPDNVISHLQLEVTADTEDAPQAYFDKPLHLILTDEDQRVLGSHLTDYVTDLMPAKLLLYGSDETAWQQSKAEWERLGIVTEVCDAVPERPVSYAFDSIVYPLFLLYDHARNPMQPLTVFLRDTGSPDRILQGQSAIITSSGIKKPAYYACVALSRVRGDIIAQGNQYCVLHRGQGANEKWIVLAGNFHESLQHICQNDTALWDVKGSIDAFRDELNLRINLNLKPGGYSVIKYGLTRENTLFSHLAALDFNENALLPCSMPNLLSFYPTLETYTEDICATCSVNFLLRGAGVQLAVIRPHDRQA